MFSRLDNSGATSEGESFAYDALDRLTAATTQLGDQSETMNPPERTLSYAYDKLGSLTGRASTATADRGLSGTSFGDGATPGPNALTAATIGAVTYAIDYDAGGKVIRYDDIAGGDDTLIGWNGRGLAESIDVADDAGPAASETFAYGPGGQRYHRKSVWNDGGATRTEHTFYAGAFEERLLDGNADYASVQKTRVGASIVEVRTLSHPDTTNNNEQTAVSSLEYLHRDHLGSVEAVTDATGARLATLAHDPFGARRKADWTRSLNSGEIEALADDLKLKVSRGYSDHEHLDRGGFIHMNGRVHDPRTGRFLSPDPIVENPAFSQSWHSYSYVANSPLSLVDPTGLSIAPCPIPAADFSCNPIGSPGGFGGAIETILSTIHRVSFGFFVYKTPSVEITLGSEGLDIEFGVIHMIGVIASVASEIVERKVRVDNVGETDIPMEASQLQAATLPNLATFPGVADGLQEPTNSIEYEQSTVIEGKWVIIDIDYKGVSNTLWMTLLRIARAGENRGPLSDGKDYEGTRRIVTQEWKPLTPVEEENLRREGKAPVERPYGETKTTEQIYFMGSDSWHPKGRSWQWHPVVPDVEYDTESL